MYSPMRWPETFLVLFFLSLQAYRWTFGNAPLTGGIGVHAAQWTSQRKLDTRNQVRDLWYHGYDNYMKHAFPMDELAPLSCRGRGPDWRSPENIAYNDVDGNYSVTLVDSLDTLVVLNDKAGFEDAVQKVIQWVSFDVNTKPQVFETNIRVLGGLLSAHIFANQTGQPFHLPWYQGELLAMSKDLGERLLRAFATPTGIPFARINLRSGLQRGESIESCTAGAGSLILEFATLSRLTGDDRFEKAAKKAFFAIWNRKSDIGLVGNTINIWTGAWTYPEVSGIGAGIDSFFEYALKWYIMSGEPEFLDVWNDSYAAIMRYARSADGFWYRRVNIHTGDVAYFTMDSLAAFWPGLQVLAGDIENAIKSHMTYWHLWKRHSGLPEIWDMNFRVATSLQFPLRPEFIESTWYLYRATHDTIYLDIGERILHDFALRSKVDCGLSSIQDLRDNTRDDRMESFVLSETLKYLYLLFDESNSLHSDGSNYVFTTEGHLLTLGHEHLKPVSPKVRKLRGKENYQCPAYQPMFFGVDAKNGLMVGIGSRPDVEYVRHLIGTPFLANEEYAWHSNGWCDVPGVDLFSYDFILSADGRSTVEDLSPSMKKVTPVSDGYIVQNVSGLRARIVSRLDGKGYDVTKLGPHTIHTGQLVYLNDSALTFAASKDKQDQPTSQPRLPDVDLHFFIDFVDPKRQLQPAVHRASTDMLITGHTAMFGGNPFSAVDSNGYPLRFAHGEGVALVRAPLSNPLGCHHYDQEYLDDAIVVQRGDCTFLEKLRFAQLAGASGVVVLTDEDLPINPGADDDELDAIGDTLDDVVITVLRRADSKELNAMLDLAETHGLGQPMVVLESTGDAQPAGWGSTTKEVPTPTSSSTTAPNSNRVLYLNGHPLLNTRLMV